MLFLPRLQVLLLLTTHGAATSLLFQNWFSGFDHYFTNRLQSACQQEYQTYLIDPSCPSCSIEYPLNGTQRGAISVIDCLLNHTEEFIKANTAVGTVILGMLPTILSFSGSTTTEIGLLALRRPLLATMLATASPSIYPIRALTYDDPASILEPGHAPFPLGDPPSVLISTLSSILQYLIAATATANVATQIWSLCVQSISALGPDFIFWPLLWPITTLPLHLLGWIYVALRVRVDPPSDSSGGGGEKSSGSKNSFKERLSSEFTPSIAHKRYIPPCRPQTLLSAFVAWLASVLTICHIIYGTATLSSLLFVSAVDAIYVALRLWASAIVARAVVMYELSGMATPSECST